MSPVQFSSQFSLPGLQPGADQPAAGPNYNAPLVPPSAMFGHDRVTFGNKTDEAAATDDVSSAKPVNADPPAEQNAKAESGGVKRFIKPAVKLLLAAGLGAAALAGSPLAVATFGLGLPFVIALAVPAALLGLSGLKDLLGAFSAGKTEKPTEEATHTEGDGHVHDEEEPTAPPGEAESLVELVEPAAPEALVELVKAEPGSEAGYKPIESLPESASGSITVSQLAKLLSGNGTPATTSQVIAAINSLAPEGQSPLSSRATNKTMPADLAYINEVGEAVYKAQSAPTAEG